MDQRLLERGPAQQLLKEFSHDLSSNCLITEVAPPRPRPRPRPRLTIAFSFNKYLLKTKKFILDGYIHNLRELRELGVDKISRYIRL